MKDYYYTYRENGLLINRVLQKVEQVKRDQEELKNRAGTIKIRLDEFQKKLNALGRR